jgi:hypothetical protein
VAGRDHEQPQQAATATDAIHRKYKPALVWHDRPLSLDDYVPLNTPQDGLDLPVRLHLQFASLSDFTLMDTIRETMMMKKDDFASVSQQASLEDAVNEVFSGTSVNMLILACLASGLHMIFEFLAFQSDVEFWTATTSLVGLSVRSVNIELISQIIVLLYLWDSLASQLIIVPSVLGIGLQLWKLWRVVQIENAAQMACTAGAEVAPASDSAAKMLQEITLVADNVSTKILTACLLPLVLLYSLWSLVVHMHYSWYNWLIATLTACTYAFGFVSMFPQLYINYKLQSVSHLPWKFLVFRFLSTVIDDIFAFVIKTPLMHRVSVFRDDIIFLFYLWQRWAYKVDSTRPPER